MIDQCAYTNDLRDLSPKIKVSYSFLLIILALVSENVSLHLLILLLNTLILRFIAKIKLKNYFKLLLLPMVFILLGIISVVVNLSTNQLMHPIISYKVYSLYLGITRESIGQGALLLTRSIAAISASYFMLLTTPMIDLIKLLKSLRLPKEIVEIMVLTYKFIFILLDESKKIYEAQVMRNGYKNIKKSYKSIAILIKMLFINTFNRYKAMEETLQVRQFSGEFYL
jgi:cobalt/nickel transport system permease protein